MAKLDLFQHSNRLRRLNRWLQILLALSFVAAVNYIAMRHFGRFDLTRQHRFSLSPETLAYVHDLREPVRVVVTFTQEAGDEELKTLYQYISDLLQEYAYASRRDGQPRIRVEYVDLYKDRVRAESLTQEFGSELPNAILISSGDRRRVIPAGELIEFEDKKPIAYAGEKALTSALIEVATQSQPTLYFLTGHGEMRLDDPSPGRGLTTLASELDARNFRLGALDLSQQAAVPADAQLLVIVDPQGPFLAAELEKLRDYLTNHAGRVLLFLGPGRNAGLDDLLYDWGLRADDMLVLEQSRDFMEGSGSYLIRQFGPHPITEILIKNQTALVSGPFRPLRPDPGAPVDERLRLTPLVGSSKQSWAERAYRQGQAPRFDAGTDLPGPVTIGAVAERRAASSLGINVPGGRLIAFGSGDLLANRRISALGNFNLVLGSIQWAVERDQLLAIPPRPIDRYQLNVSWSELRVLAWVFLIVPGTIGVLGILVVWMRRL